MLEDTLSICKVIACQSDGDIVAFTDFRGRVGCYLFWSCVDGSKPLDQVTRKAYDLSGVWKHQKGFARTHHPDAAAVDPVCTVAFLFCAWS